MAKLYIVGTGPGSPEYVTPVARKVVAEAHLVIGAERSLNLFEENIKGQTLTLTAKNVEYVLKEWAEAAKNGKNAVLLSTGDPGFSGLLGSVLRRHQKENVEIEVVPGISSMQACAAKLSICWDNAVLLTFHDDAGCLEKKQKLAEAVKAGKPVLVLPEPKNFPPSAIATYLIAEGINRDKELFVCENLTLTNEKIIKTTLENASKQEFSSLCILVIK
jgi:cobalt-precorrin-7 (C5)-methyltransferase